MQQSGQTYLETIYLLKRENGRVKSIDVAKALGFSKPSVSRAMGKLSLSRHSLSLSRHHSHRHSLSNRQQKAGPALVEKQETLTQFLMMTADVDQETAEDDARKMMHFISKKSFQGIRNFIKQVEELN